MRFAKAEIAQQVVQKFRKNPSQIGSKNVWCKPDRPILERVQVSLLLGLRRQLSLWGSYKKNQMRINETYFHMAVDNKRVMSTTIDDGKIKLNWHSAEWDSWTELKESDELRALIQTANTKLSQASSTNGKVKGKTSTSLASGQAA